MLWFKRLFSSRQKLVDMPNFATAPWVDIDLSGTKLRFKNPPKSQGIIVGPPMECGPEKLDIYNLDNFELWPNEKGGEKIIVTRLGIKHRIVDNLLQAKQSLRWCFDCQYDDYNSRNESIKKKYPQRLASAMEEFGSIEFAPPLNSAHPP